MKLPIYQVDAFTTELFRGNPAAVVPLTEWLPDKIMQDIAAENNLAETAFFVRAKDHYSIRWFTPTTEVELCGHATLASAHVLYHHLNYQKEEIIFQTNKRGNLRVSKSTNGFIMDFPSDTLNSASSEDRELIAEMFADPIVTCLQGKDDILVIVEDELLVRDFQPDYSKIKNLAARGMVLSARSVTPSVDFVSRCFFPKYGIDEDPVTGSAHTLLTPYWVGQLSKDTLRALQASPRSGIIECQLQNDRVLLGGTTITYLIGQITTEGGLSS